MIDVEEAGKYIVLKPDFDLAGSNLEEIRNKIFDLGAKGNYWVTLDLSKVGFIDSMGLGVIVVCLNTLRDYGGDLKVHAKNPEIIRLFELLNLEGVLIENVNSA